MAGEAAVALGDRRMSQPPGLPARVRPSLPPGRALPAGSRRGKPSLVGLRPCTDPGLSPSPRWASGRQGQPSAGLTSLFPPQVLGLQGLGREWDVPECSCLCSKEPERLQVIELGSGSDAVGCKFKGLIEPWRDSSETLLGKK